MKHVITTVQPFSFPQSLAFIRRFPPCQGDYLVGEASLTAAIAVDGRAVPFTVAGERDLLVETEVPALAARAADFLGAHDDLTGFYAAADGDAPFRRLVHMLHGLHHVRFLTLEEIAVYCVMMQRNPVAMAARMKRKFLDRFGLRVQVGGHTLRAMPELAALAELDGAAIGEAIGNAGRGAQIANVVRGVAAIGESRLRTAPYAEARAALLAVRGIGPFSAGAILLRGLGRMDELPDMPAGTFGEAARAIYGATFDARTIRRRYGRHVGYWSYYLMTGVPRLAPDQPVRSGSGSRSKSRGNVAA